MSSAELKPLPLPDAASDLPPIRDDYAWYYGKWHSNTDAHFADMSDFFAAKLAPLLPNPAQMRVLEVGCGWGFLLAGLQKLGVKDAIGFDVDRSAIAIARGRNLPAQRVDIPDLPAFMAERAGQFDAVVAFDVLEHIPVAEQTAFLRDVLRVLKPGGRFICQVPNANSTVASRFRYNDWTHHTSFTEHSLGYVLFRAGFEDISVREADADPRPALGALKPMLWWSLRRLTRGARRLAYMAEFGRQEGAAVPLTPNILAVAHR